VSTATKNGGKIVKNRQGKRGKKQGVPRVSCPIRCRDSCFQKAGVMSPCLSSMKEAACFNEKGYSPARPGRHSRQASAPSGLPHLPWCACHPSAPRGSLKMLHTALKSHILCWE
jgi:hypothetical protein